MGCHIIALMFLTGAMKHSRGECKKGPDECRQQLGVEEKSKGRIMEKGLCTYHVVEVVRAFQGPQTLCTTG